MKKASVLSFIAILLFCSISFAQREKAGDPSKISNEFNKEVFQKKQSPALKELRFMKTSNFPKPKGSLPTPSGGPAVPCSGIPEGKLVENGGKCGDGVCDNDEYNPLYPSLATKDGEQYYLNGTCENRCAKDCGLTCPDGQQYAWDMSECKPTAEYVETKCKIPFYPYHGDFVLSMNYPTAFFLCSDDQKSIKFSLGSISVVGKNVIFSYLDGSTVEFILQKGDVLIKYADGTETLWGGLTVPLYDNATGENWGCWDLQTYNLKNKELCLESLIFFYDAKTNTVFDDLHLRYFVRYKQ